MEKPAENSILTARENGELRALLSLVQKGRLRPGGDQWQRYLDLFEAQQNGSREALDAQGPAASEEPVPAPAPYALEAPVVPDDQEGAAEFYGVSSRTVKRWVAAGREHSDPPPLRAPEEMPAWAARMRAQKVSGFVHRCPEEIEAAAAKATALKSAKPAPVQATAASAEEPAPPVRQYDISEEEKNPRQMIARLEQEEARLHRRFLDAIQEKATDAEVDQHRRRWTDASDLLQRQRNRAEKARDLISPEEVQAAFDRMIRPLPQALERAFPAEPPAAASWPETVREAIRRAFDRLPSTVEAMLAK